MVQFNFLLSFLSIFVISIYCCKDPVKCNSKTEEYLECARSPCDLKCETLGEPCNIINKKCSSKCYCKPGYARDDKNKCIPQDECPKQFCKKDEVFLECGQAPEAVYACWMIIKPHVQQTDCPRGCYCKKGYTRLSNDVNSPCIQEKFCK